MLRKLRKGQSTAEYAIVISVVIAAALAMQVYVRRGIQGKIKSAVNWTADKDMGDVKVHVGAVQYEPYYQTQDLTTGSDSNVGVVTDLGGKVTKTTTQDEARRGGSTTTEAAPDYTP